jgi:aminoglycoside 6'-N-acetyltransferase I
MTVDVRILERGDEAVLARVAPGVFDRGIDEALVAEFLADPRHHLAVAIAEDAVVGFVSAVHYVHPDKPAELWINEVGVAPTHRRRGLAARMLRAMLGEGRRLGCREAWVLTDRENTAAMRLYASAGGTEAPRDQLMFQFPL